MLTLGAEEEAQTHLGPDSGYAKYSLPSGEVSLGEVQVGFMNM
jgi:hypothetical protein